MNKQQQHFTQIDIQTELRWRICDVAQELDELRTSQEPIVSIRAEDLFYLEALGYQVDLATGLVTLVEGHQRIQEEVENCLALVG